MSTPSGETTKPPVVGGGLDPQAKGCLVVVVVGILLYFFGGAIWHYVVDLSNPNSTTPVDTTVELAPGQWRTIPFRPVEGGDPALQRNVTLLVDAIPSGVDAHIILSRYTEDFAAGKKNVYFGGVYLGGENVLDYNNTTVLSNHQYSVFLRNRNRSGSLVTVRVTASKR
ncbi:MAG: hypothetical protein ACKV2Q_36810 [Planctomycetaceae bacterium]